MMSLLTKFAGYIQFQTGAESAEQMLLEQQPTTLEGLSPTHLFDFEVATGDVSASSAANIYVWYFESFPLRPCLHLVVKRDSQSICKCQKYLSHKS